MNSAIFLTGLILLTVPWWLHRLHAHSAEQQPFSSLFLMRPSEAPVNMRRKLQHLLLLALRWLLLAAACFAFAEPFFELNGDPIANDEPLSHQLIVLDTSLSMNRAGAGASAIDSAKQQARDLIADLPSGAKASIISVADQINLITPLTDESARLNAAIAAIEAGSARLALNGLMGRITTLGDTLAAPGERLELHLISDFQASAMPDQFNALVEGSVWPLTLHPVTDDRADIGNWAISAMRYAATANQDEELNSAPATLQVTVQSFADNGAAVQVQLNQNGTPTGTENLFIAANASASVTFELPAVGRRAVNWVAQLTTTDATDALAADNIRRLVHADAQAVSLPVVGDSDRAYAYLRAAVQAAAPKFMPERVVDLQDPSAPVIVLIDPGVLGGETVRVLTRYLQSGGAVLMTAGPATRAAGRLPLLDLPLVSDRFDQTTRGVIAEDRTHPALAGFSNWQDVSFHQAVTTAANTANGGDVILSLDDGTPLLVEHLFFGGGPGGGRLMLLATALDPAWSSLVVRPAFVDFMANLLGYLAEDLLPHEALVGQPFAIPAQSVQLFDANQNPVLGLADTVGRPTVRLTSPGIYELRTPSTTRLLAVNTDLTESDLSPADSTSLERWQAVSNQKTASVVPSRAVTGSETSASSDSQPTYLLPLAPWLLILLALLVFAEPLLANTGVLQRRSQQPDLAAGTT